MAPRVSVLLPVRDAEATLPACLASLRAQSLDAFEVVAVDDGSHDGSRAQLDAVAACDGRFRVVRGPATGIVAALNAAACAARAPLLARMDADDVAHPERLAAQWARFGEGPHVDVLGTRVELFGAADNAGMRSYVAWLNGLRSHQDVSRARFVESPLAHPSVMLGAETLRALGGYRAFDGPEDYDLWLRALEAGARFEVLDRVLLRWRDGAGRLTRTDPRYGATRFRALKLESLERLLLRPTRPVVVWGAGPIGKGWARALRERGHPVAAFADVHPRRLGQRVHGAPVVGSAAAAAVEGALHLAAVGQPGGRARVVEEAARHGLLEGDRLWCVA